ncbi:retrovirus-related Pol polyprotein from type-1 retrotransposable element R2 [Caerostris darwini]|uniref:Retrovirus-related Pol polyprotein from type-1 retrotransposable element R2 n=1 Tax=Caerostris darwini TaxID=1538125 RepID=A0AAV4PKW2_9ARAC|nr:retrovirus-related Pol polyprotein from type-1 retrotransposable element R2 [Caerostris darwini]
MCFQHPRKASCHKMVCWNTISLCIKDLRMPGPGKRTLPAVGCPLSDLLFNLCVDPVLRSVRSTSGCHNVLAFADDIALLEDSPDSLQTSIDTVFDQLKSIGLKLNPSKSMSLHISGVTPVGLRVFD